MTYARDCHGPFSPRYQPPVVVASGLRIAVLAQAIRSGTKLTHVLARSDTKLRRVFL